MIAPETWAAIRPVFAQRAPQEAVVAVWEDGTWQELQNRHRAPESEFVLSREDSALLLERPPHALIHSHTQERYDPKGRLIPKDMPSDVDCASQIATGWTWGIVAIDIDPQGIIYGVHPPRFWGDAVPRAPLLGRRWEWVYSDCFTLFRDWHTEQGISLPDVPRIWDDKATDRDGNPVYSSDHFSKRYMQHFIERLGFEYVERCDKKPGDACVRRSGESSHLDHVCVWLGNGKYLDISRDMPSTEYTPPNGDDERFMRVTGARFYRLKRRK